MNILKKVTAVTLCLMVFLGTLSGSLSFGGKAAAADDKGATAIDSVTLETSTWYLNTPRFHITTASGYTTDAYCVEPAKGPPTDGMLEGKNISAVNDESIRNVLYYGFNGPGMNTVNAAFSTGNSGYEKSPKGAMQYFRNRDNLAVGLSETAYFYTFTHYAASYAMYGSEVAFGVNPGYEEYTYKEAVTSYVTAIRNGIQSGKLPNKSAFIRVYLIHVSDSKQNIIYPVYRMKLELNKASFNPDFTDGNTVYSLNGAQFVIFRNKDAADAARKQIPNTAERKAGSIQQSGGTTYIYTNENGKGYFKNLGYGADNIDYAIVDIDNYYIVEYCAPKGYAISNNYYGFSDSGKTDKDGLPIYTLNSSFKDKNGNPLFPDVPQMVLKMTKQSSNPLISGNNSCYSLEGAEYTVFTDENCTKPLSDDAVIVTDEYGNGSLMNGRAVDAEEVWAKETKAPKGYALDTNRYKFTFSGEYDSDGIPVYSFTCSDKPETDPVTVLLQKYDATTGKGTNTEKLAGAEFTVKFYPAYYDSVEEIGDSLPLRSWTFKTNSNGFLNYSKQYFVSGDDFWFDEEGGVKKPSIPYGTITIEETKAPNGYQLNPTVYLANINENNGNISWRTTNDNIDEGVLQFPETQDNGGLEIYKSSTDNKVDGIWFRVSATGYSKDFCTNANGLITNSELSNLPIDKEYTVEELGFKKADGSYYYPKRYGNKPAAQTVRLESGKTKSVSFINKTVLADLTVKKTSDDGYISDVYFKMESTDGVEHPVFHTNGYGIFSINNLAVYDDNDIPIRYTVMELGFKNNDGGYYIPERYQKPQPQTFTLEKGDYVVNEKIVKSVMFHNSLLYGYAMVIKTDKDTGKPLAGCTFGLYSNKNCNEDQLLDTCVTGENGEGLFPKKQVAGTFFIKEIACPPGYTLCQDVKYVKITENNQAQNAAASVKFSDTPTETYISKMDITGTQEIEGATLTVADVDNLSTIIDEWVSSKSPHVIKRLERGHSYVLTEKIPAPGYVTAESITFTVNEDGSVTEVTMNDDTTKIEIIKVDANHQMLAGVELQIIDDETDEVVVPKWVTDGAPCRIDGKLIVGKTYRLHEISTLPQYVIAEDVSFTVEDTAKVQPITMVNMPKTGSVTLHKQDGDGNPLAGSQWQLFTSEGAPITAVHSGNGKYHFSASAQMVALDTDDKGVLCVDVLPPGEYYMVEVKAPDNMQPFADKIPFTISCEDQNSLNVSFTVKDTHAVLFDTGSFGVTPIYIAGAIGLALVIAGFSVYLFIKKKSKNQE